MKNLFAVICLVLAFSMSQPAQAGPLRFVGHVIKKTVMLPVYVVGGAGGALILWWHVGGHEDEIGDAFAGISRGR